ncbi:MAG: T9SS type A sorting domain-containing protein [Bacteroidetes bacterium]|nr:MAG: T9SS type A sorting domain-containing protein [Bacteroidota bacterium]
MKKVINYLIFLVILTSLNFAAVPYNMRMQAEQQKNKQIDNSNIAYQIRLDGKKLADGSYEPVRVYNIERVGSQHYFQNMFILKTKQYYKVGKEDVLLGTTALQSKLSELKIKKINAPFSQKAESELLSADIVGLSRIYEIYYEENVDPYEICAELMKNPDVEYAVPVFKRYTNIIPNDPKYKDNSQWGLKKIGMETAWSISQGDTNVVIGIVDSGTDWSHEDLEKNIYINRGEDGLDDEGKSKRTNGKDDDDNDKIDDWHGWALVGNVTNDDISNSIWKENNNPKNPLNTHGTHVAGCASAVTDNGKGVAGPGFKCKLLPVKCSADQDNEGYIFRGYVGIVYAADMGCKVINCSWGGAGSSPAEQDAITYAYHNKGAVVVVAAGNLNGFNIDQGGQYPANYDHVLCVGATKSNDQVAGFSNIGRHVDVYTPGEGIMATLPNNSYGNNSGTSMASPITAGVVALVRSLHPTWSVDKVMHQIRSTSDNVVDPNNRSYYYGRINASNALQFNNGGSQNIPGVEVESFTIAGGNSLTSSNSTLVTLKITNYLSQATNLVIRLSPMSSYLTIEDTTITLGNLRGEDSTNANIIVQLLPSNPWYNGTADFLVTFESGSYRDYQIVKLPVNIYNNNLYTRLAPLNTDETQQWFTAMATSETNVWAVGRNGVFRGNSGYLKWRNSPEPKLYLSGANLYSLYAFDESRVFMGSGNNNGQAAIYRTIDGGQSPWESKDVSNITGFINDIHFFDNNNGIFLGDPKNNKFGVGVTSNGGQNWTAVNAPAPLSGETGLVQSVSWLGDYGWFGTTKGRVFRTTNRGATWLESSITGAAVTHLLSFRDNLNGIAIYSETNDVFADRIVASTSNGGSTWLRNKSNLTKKGFSPVHLFYPDSSSMIYALCLHGEVLGTSDYGTTWYPALTEKEGKVLVGGHVKLNENRVRLWEVGSAVGYLDFGYIPLNANRDLELVSGNQVNYDSVFVGSIFLKNVEIKNKGNIDVNIFSANINYSGGVDSSEFSFFGNPVTPISPGGLKKIKIKFQPAKIGVRTAGLYIKSDGSPDEFSIVLTGVGKDTSTSAVETNEFDNFYLNNISPNPVSVMAYVGFTVPTDGYVEISLYNSLGIEMKSIYNGNASAGENVIPINTDEFTPGVYYIRMKYGERILTRKFVVSR